MMFQRIKKAALALGSYFQAMEPGREEVGFGSPQSRAVERVTFTGAGSQSEEIL
jgi:hypothetical protein